MIRRLLASAPPTVAVEIAPRRVAAAAVALRGGRLAVTAHASEPLASGLVTPALNAVNVHDAGELARAVARVFERLGGRPRRVALAIPDSAAKVSLMQFEKVPPRAADFDELVRWQMRKSAPFKMDEAQVSCLPGLPRTAGAHEFVVVVARRDILREYEAAIEAAGAQAGLVDLTTFNVINTVLAAPAPPSGDWLLVHVTSDYATIAIVRDQSLVFFRNRSNDSEGSLADLVHQTAMYYEDRLKGAGFARALLAGAGLLAGDLASGPETAERIRHTLEERLHTKVDAVDPRSVAGLIEPVAAGPDLLDALAPLVGLIARQQERAA